LPGLLPNPPASAFAFVSQNAPKNVKNDASHAVERNTPQVIENNQGGHARRVTTLRTRSTRNCEANIEPVSAGILTLVAWR
jgi:hypothetical protein